MYSTSPVSGNLAYYVYIFLLISFRDLYPFQSTYKYPFCCVIHFLLLHSNSSVISIYANNNLHGTTEKQQDVQKALAVYGEVLPLLSVCLRNHLRDFFTQFLIGSHALLRAQTSTLFISLTILAERVFYKTLCQITRNSDPGRTAKGGGGGGREGWKLFSLNDLKDHT